MAKSVLTDLLTSLSGKLSKRSRISFRMSVKGKTSAYIQKKHSRKSLHSPAQERHRQLLSMAAKSAFSIMHDDDKSDQLEMLKKTTSPTTSPIPTKLSPPSNVTSCMSNIFV